jgi:hypothetical protein
MAGCFCVSAALIENCLPVQKTERPKQKNECAISVIPFEQWQSSLVKTKASKIIFKREKLLDT